MYTYLNFISFYDDKQNPTSKVPYCNTTYLDTLKVAMHDHGHLFGNNTVHSFIKTIIHFYFNTMFLLL